jgi:glucose/arabinose dehydrogenase
MRRLALPLLGALLFAPAAAHALLNEPGFRAVPVASADHPISHLAVAPDGRLFAAVQAEGLPETAPRGTAEIRVYDEYSATDGSRLDAGTSWVTLTDVHVENNEEGLLGIALAPDFPTSKLLYVHVTTSSDGDVPAEFWDQEIRVYRENDEGLGEYVATVRTGLELTSPSTRRNGGHMEFGPDGCLYAGVGDGGSGNRWSAQTRRGLDRTSGEEATTWCDSVCLGTEDLPNRLLEEHDGLPNQAGKVLRLAVEGPSIAQGASGAPEPTQPYLFAAGFRDPMGLLSHPLTGQIYVGDRADGQEAEIDLVEPGANYGWPCLEGSQVFEGCAVGADPGTILGNHPSWRAPLVVHPGSGEVVTGLAAYTGLGYPAEFYGDVFYLLRNGARIYRLDLEAPCFTPPAGTQAPLPFHDDDEDNDFRLLYDIDGDGDLDFTSFTNLMDITQGPGPLGQDVLYVAARRGNSNDMEDDTVVFRIEFATEFEPFLGRVGRVDDSCFDGTDNPFRRPSCLPPGGFCPGAEDGTPCDDGDVCNGSEVCVSGVCQHQGALGADGTACTPAADCFADGVCQSGYCVSPGLAEDGAPCPDADPCNGFETCLAGTCIAGAGPEPFAVKALKLRPEASGAVVLSGTLTPPASLAPDVNDVTLTLSDGTDTLYSAAVTHPDSDLLWRGSGNKMRLKDPAGTFDGVTKLIVRQKKERTKIVLKSRDTAVGAPAGPDVTARLVIGPQCFETALGCSPKGTGLRCKP